MGTKTINISGQSFNLPERTAKLLFISDDEAPGTAHNLSMTVTLGMEWDEETDELEFTTSISDTRKVDPSTIFVDLPVHEPTHPETIERPGYYPSYYNLSPEQRWIYLNWLQDPSQPILPSYVFIYFYGLERQLLSPNASDAISEMLMLFQYHSENQSSFEYYCLNSLGVVFALNHENIDLNAFQPLLEQDSWTNLQLILSAFLKQPLRTKELLAIANHLNTKDLNKRYLKDHPDVYTEQLERVMKSHCSEYPWRFFNTFSLDTIERAHLNPFANKSLDLEQIPETPNYLESEDFMAYLKNLYKITHEATKQRLKELRKM